MKSDLIVLGVEYVVAIRPKHVLIPGTEITYAERLKALDAMAPTYAEQARMPKGWQREHKRLMGAMGNHGGLQSRLDRCQNLRGKFLWDEVEVGQRRLFDQSLGVIATAVEKLPKGRVVVAAEFGEQGRLGLLDTPHGPTFDPSLPDEEELDEDEDASIEEIEAQMNGLRDVCGTLHAIVALASVKHLWTPDLPERLTREAQEKLERQHAEHRRRWDESDLRHAERGVERAIDQILREPEDDDWEPLA